MAPDDITFESVMDCCEVPGTSFQPTPTQIGPVQDVQKGGPVLVTISSIDASSPSAFDQTKPLSSTSTPESSDQLPSTSTPVTNDQVPPRATTCITYNDLLGAIQGLTKFADSEWYPQVMPALYRLREFVAVNMDTDLNYSSQPVQLASTYSVTHGRGYANAAQVYTAFLPCCLNGRSTPTTRRLLRRGRCDPQPQASPKDCRLHMIKKTQIFFQTSTTRGRSRRNIDETVDILEEYRQMRNRLAHNQ